MDESEIRLNCFLPVIGTVLQERRKSKKKQTKPIRLRNTVMAIFPFRRVAGIRTRCLNCKWPILFFENRLPLNIKSFEYKTKCFLLNTECPSGGSQFSPVVQRTETRILSISPRSSIPEKSGFRSIVRNKSKSRRSGLPAKLPLDHLCVLSYLSG